MGKVTHKLIKEEGLLRISFGKFQLKLLENDDPTWVFSPKYLMSQDIIHGVRICVNRGCTEQNVMTELLDHNDHGQRKFLHMQILGFRI